LRRNHGAGACAYCHQPLQLIAGFCAVCHAPQVVASRQGLVAKEQSMARQPLTMLGASHVVVGAQRQVQSPRPRWLRPLLAVSVIALVLAAFFVTLHLNGNDLSSVLAHRSGTLTASATAQGASATTFSVNQPYYLTYSLKDAQRGSRDGALVRLEITRLHAHVWVLNEHWPPTAPPRTLPLVALTPGAWHIALIADNQALQSIDLLIVPEKPAV